MIVLVGLAAVLGAVAGAAVLAYERRWHSARVIDAPHVRLHIVHEGSAAGDVTIDGLQVAERRDRSGQRWLVLHDAAMILPNQEKQWLEGETLVPVARVIARQSISDVVVGPIEVNA